jgi:4-amino-4-deoxy-L-arabinose transferase-like glycosyltransferase
MLSKENMYNLLSKVSLSSWDEAWYGEISKNILNSGNLFEMSYNGRSFFDHPPFVMWMQTMAMSFFGVNEFSVRLPSLIFGIGTLFVVFLLGKEMFGKISGFFAALTLIAAPWYLTRTLSGNLDIPLTFLFTLTFYLCFKATKSTKFLVPLAISTGFLFLTKSLVPFTILPLVIFSLWKKVSLKDLMFPVFIFLIIVTPWFAVNYINNPDLIQRYLSIGYPGAKTDTNIFQNVLLTKTYLHNGIGNIFIYGFISLILGILFHAKKYLPFAIFISVFMLPFAFSNKGHIWHLIPLYPFWILVFYGFVEQLFLKTKINNFMKFIVFFIVFISITFLNIKRNWYEIINVSAYTSDLEILSNKSKDYDYPLVLDDDSVPEVLFYSNKGNIERTSGRGDLRRRFDTKNNFLLITRDWRLEEEKINTKEYNLIAKDRDKVLILKK